MFSILKKKIDLHELKIIAEKLANKSAIGNIYLLNGELGVGKTTFARFFINKLFRKYKIKEPISIKSPSFPLLINYSIKKFDVLHYDLYRLKNENEIIELNVIENLKKNITIIEWPDIINNYLKLNEYISISLKFLSSKKRDINIMHINKDYLNE